MLDAHVQCAIGDLAIDVALRAADGETVAVLAYRKFFTVSGDSGSCFMALPLSNSDLEQ